MRNRQRSRWLLPVGLCLIATSNGCENAPVAPSADVGGPVDVAAVEAPDDRSASPGDIPSVRLVRAFVEYEFDRPVFLTYPPGQPERWFVVAEIPKTDRGKLNRAAVREACLARRDD